jgi:hypothetical protein
LLVGEGSLVVLKAKLFGGWFRFAGCGVFGEKKITEGSKIVRGQWRAELKAFFFDTLFHWVATCDCYHISILFFYTFFG